MLLIYTPSLPAFLIAHCKLSEQQQQVAPRTGTVAACAVLFSRLHAVYAQQLTVSQQCSAFAQHFVCKGAQHARFTRTFVQKRCLLHVMSKPCCMSKPYQLNGLLTVHTQWWRHLVLRHSHRQLPPWWKLPPQGKARRPRLRVRRRRGPGGRRTQQHPRRP